VNTSGNVDFAKTPEPAGVATVAGATRVRDFKSMRQRDFTMTFRLELDARLKSWACQKAKS